MKKYVLMVLAVLGFAIPSFGAGNVVAPLIYRNDDVDDAAELIYSGAYGACRAITICHTHTGDDLVTVYPGSTASATVGWILYPAGYTNVTDEGSVVDAMCHTVDLREEGKQGLQVQNAGAWYAYAVGHNNGVQMECIP